MLITVDKAIPGMKITDDVVLPNGTTLIQKSSYLTDNSISMLKKYSIDNIRIEDSSNTSHINDSEIPISSPKENKLPQKEKILPDIRVVALNNGSSANLYITPTGKKDETFSIDDLKQILFNQNITFGIGEPLLLEAVSSWQKDQKVYEFENIAKGIPAYPLKEGRLEILVKHIYSGKDLEIAQNAEYCWELKNTSVPIQRVDNGTIIAEKGIRKPAISGRNIFGEEVTTDEIQKTEVKTDENVEYNEDKNSYFSLITGLVYNVNGVLGVVPINFDGSAEIKISSDLLQASLIVHPAMENGNPSKKDYIKSLIFKSNVIFGLKEKLLLDIYQRLNEGISSEEPVVIAEGIPHINGEDGRIEYHFETETSLAPKEDASGNVDYKNISIIRPVNKGDELARIIPPTKGEIGKNIFGEEIPCNKGKEVKLPAGPNTIVNPENKNILIAQIDGNVSLRNNLIEIYEGFVVKGNVNYATGNIEYEKSVLVKEDVKSGFNITCGGDLEVGGTIEDSEINVSGSILCRYGFTGQGKGSIRCNGDVNIGYMKNQSIRCRNNVIIAKEALNCTIYAKKSIKVLGRSLSIAGGTFIARDSITCNVVGNSSGIQTTLEVGLDYTLIEELEKCELQQNEITENKRKLLETLKHLESKLRFQRKLPPKEESFYKKVRTAITKFERQNKALEDRKKLIEKKMKDFSKSFIKIERSAMPGTLIKIGERNLIVHEEIKGPKTIRMVNFEIQVL